VDLESSPQKDSGSLAKSEMHLTLNQEMRRFESYMIHQNIGCVAKRTEHSAVNRRYVGSIPTVPAKFEFRRKPQGVNTPVSG
jgi:hypothetical protein